MLSFHFLNVAHGDSIVIELRSDDGPPAFGLVDSKLDGAGEPPALIKLRELGAERLSFVALTHPHADHFSGLHQILDAYSGRIDAFYTFPIDQTRDRIRKFAQSYANAVTGASGKAVKATFELVRILHFAANHLDGVWEAPAGFASSIYAPGFSGVEIRLLQPPARVRGALYQAIDEGIISSKDELPNDLSLALEFNYGGKRIILGGDATAKNWRYVRQRYGPEKPLGTLKADIAKIPHHGSQRDCEPLVLDFLFRPTILGEAIGIISADGKSHPSREVIEGLQSRGVRPYCTNLATFCSAGEVRNMVTDAATDPKLLRFINQASIGTQSHIQPCQGAITVTVDPQGTVDVGRQFQNACPFRGDFDEILATL